MPQTDLFEQAKLQQDPPCFKTVSRANFLSIHKLPRCVADRHFLNGDVSLSKLGGHFGCNSITADYSGDPDRLDIGSVFLTRATCEAAKATVEADLYAILRGRLRITLPEDTDWVIELTSPEGRVIRLGRVVYR